MSFMQVFIFTVEFNLFTILGVIISGDNREWKKIKDLFIYLGFYVAFNTVQVIS